MTKLGKRLATLENDMKKKTAKLAKDRKMAKKLHITNAKVEIDGEDGYAAHKWNLTVGIEGLSEIIISCHDLDDALKLQNKPHPMSAKDNPRRNILLVDLRGVELRYSADLVNVERTPVEDGIDQIEYRFMIIG